MMVQINHRSGVDGVNFQTPAVTRLMSASGRMNFHAKFISWSMRRRGSVARIQINMAISTSSFAKNQKYEGTQVRIESGADHPPRNSVIAIPLMANMPIY